MKQTTKISLIVTLLLVLVACGNKPDPSPALQPTMPPQAEQLEPAVEATSLPAEDETSEVPAAEESESADGAIDDQAGVAADENPYPVTLTPCSTPPGGDEIEGETIICGTVSVPENYDEPAGIRIPISFALLKATTDSPAPDPVIFLHGGPGSGELLTLAPFTEDFATLRQDRDVIVFDQRGAGFSNDPINCAVELIRREEEISDAVTQASPENADKVKQAKILEICAEAALERGADLAQYNTINNAQDVQSLVAALGYEEFNLYGHSYGTKLALETMRQQPAGLRSVILDSAVPPHVKFYSRPNEAAVEAAQALFAACAVDDVCDAAYPDLESRFNQLMVQLEDAPIALDDDQFITPAAVVGLFNLRNSRYNGPGISAYLPRMIAELEQGVTDTYVGLVDGSLLPPSPFADEEFDPDEEEDDLPDMTPAETFNMQAISMELLQTDPSVRSAYFSLPQQSANLATLLDFIDQHIPEEQAADLVEIAQTLDEDDVAELFSQIQKFAAIQPNLIVASVIVPLHLFTCNESMPFNTMEDAEAYIESAPVPAFMQGALAAAVKSIELCDGLPTGTVDDSFHDPVSSDIPILVLAGLNDTQTAISWGAAAVETMSNGRFTTFPESGHGVYQFSQCAKDIAAAFFNQPDAAPDTACIDALNPEFALP